MMLGVVEILLFLSPFLLYALWRVLTPMLAPLVVWAALMAVVVLAASGAWYATRVHLAPWQRYVAAHSENGQIVPGHGQ